jgi:hypothetical protein
MRWWPGIRAGAVKEKSKAATFFDATLKVDRSLFTEAKTGEAGRRQRK